MALNRKHTKEEIENLRQKALGNKHALGYRFTEEQKAKIKGRNKGKKCPAHSLRLTGRKRPEHSVLMKRYAKEGRLSIMGAKSENDKQIISERNKKWIKENGHPRGMLGKSHTTNAKKLAGERAMAMWSNPNSKVNSDEHRQMLSDRATRQHANGFLNQNYSRTKMGKYNINEKLIFFRSSWEANYALYLDFLVKQGQIKGWQFEVDTFWFEKTRRGVRSYKPDFKVTNTNDSVEYHEVKGWMDAKSKTKIKRMAKYYPKVKLVVIEQDSYRDIKKKLGSMLGFY